MKINKIGHVIILNGPSAVGKSSLQKAVQENSNKPYLSIGIDNFFNDIFPDEHGSLAKKPKGSFNADDLRTVSKVEIEGKEAFKLNIGETGLRIVKGMHQAIKAYALCGNNLVVDYIAYEEDWLADLKLALKDIPHIFIKVDLPLEILEKREFARSTSPVGHARSHYFTVHKNWEYDLQVDTHELSSEQAAKKILTFLKD